MMPSLFWTHVSSVVLVGWRIALRSLTRIGRVAMVISLAMTLTLAGFLFFAVRGGIGDSAVPDGALRVVLLFVFGMGCLLPLLSFHRGGVTDPSALFRYPVHPISVFVGMVLARLLSLGSLFPLAIGSAIAVEFAGDRALLWLPVLGIYSALHLGVLVITQAGLLAFHTLLASRRVRDILNVSGALLGVGIYLGMTALRRDATGTDLGVWSATIPETIWKLLPSTWAADAIVVVTGGAAVSWTSGAGVVGLLLIVMLGSIIGGRASQRAFWAEIQSEGPARERSMAHEPFSGLAWLPVPGLIRCMVLRELTHLRRDPVLKSLLIRQLGFVVIPILLPFLNRQVPTGSEIVYVIGFFVLIGGGELLLNLLAIEGRGLSHLRSHPIRMRDALLAKNLAYGACLLPINLGAMLLVDGLLGFPIAPVLVAWVGVGNLAVATAIGNLGSIYFPIPLPSATKRAIQSTGREGSRGRLTGRFAFLGFILLATSPVLVLAIVTERVDVFGRLVCLSGITIYSALVYLLTLSFVDRVFEHRAEAIGRSIGG
ncbi:MAG: hypothetical protein KDC38_05010 [Planctomycetes bacterium]|nr:hypothetical protein [Planctomycetota bacterium]